MVKVNRRGTRQERVLGIDRECVYNIARSTSGGGDAREKALGAEISFATSSLRDGLLKSVGLRTAQDGTKNPRRFIRDLLDVYTNDGEPSTFTLLFKENQDLGKEGSKGQNYDAASPHEAVEIVAKLTYLMSMHQVRTQRLTDRSDYS